LQVIVYDDREKFSMRKILLLLMIVGLLVPVALAQDSEETPEPEATAEMEMEPVEPWTCPEGYEGQTLSVFNWSTYIAEDTIPNFEEACGVTVNYDIFESNAAMLSRIRQGNPGYDIVVPSGNTVAVMIREELLIPLDKDLIPNIDNLNPALLDAPYDPGNEYTVPYQWGTVGFGYNTETIPDGISTWEDLWNYEGPVAWLDDRRVILGVGLQQLGYDPNSENPDEIAEARDYLLDQSANVVAVAADDGQVLLERGDVDITIEYSGDIIDLGYTCECDTYAYVIPEDGSNVWTDNLAIPIDAPNAELAMVFIDYILHPQVGADISNFTAYGSPNLAAVENGLIDEELLGNPGIYPSEEVEERLWVAREVSAEAEEAYNNAWDELLIFLGQ
jgi:spermidine/putrescine transport system substrate-binding protein